MLTASTLTVFALVLGAASMSCVRPMCGMPGARAMSSMQGVEEPMEEASAVDHARCTHPVQVLASSTLAVRRYDVLSRVSVACAPSIPGDCDESFRARACAMGADAVVVDDTQVELVRASTAPDRRVMNAALVRWAD